MLITLSRRTVICQSVTEVYCTGVVSLGAVDHILKFLMVITMRCYTLIYQKNRIKTIVAELRDT